jgi:hypothetical protein
MALRPLTGLSGLAGYQVNIEQDAQASPEERMGGVADPAHGKYIAEAYIPRGAQMGSPIGPTGVENQMLADEGWFWEGGGFPSDDPQFDHTPPNHAGPWPKGFQSGPVGAIDPDTVGRKLTALAELRGMGLNGDQRAERVREEPLNDTWVELNELNPGETLLQAPGSKQLMSSGFGWGFRDRTQSMAAQNSYGFDSAHMHRRWATGSLPGNYMYLRPGGRPMMKSLPGPARPAIGPNSPFTGQDLGFSFNPDGAVLQNVPTEYVAPPNPTLQAAPNPSANDSFVEWY